MENVITKALSMTNCDNFTITLFTGDSAIFNGSTECSQHGIKITTADGTDVFFNFKNRKSCLDFIDAARSLVLSTKE